MTAVRVATVDDAAAVTALLEACYPTLMTPHYDPAVMARALPLMCRANPSLLASSTFYIAMSTEGTTLGCGGWTLARPGAPDDPVDPTLGHIRHFATHPDAVRRGVARAIFARCAADARAAGVARFECFSALGAEPFYAAMGFRAVGPMAVAMGPDLRFPSTRMVMDLA
ncbi:GCN5-related N-acetyltransferase [Caenispirillum salinarum AK4]|uniref:GCN5-related N-acetyltransferase n=1 Tax=Caenispirillum salinarum AK4 TaxID=1238182 RepID=K9H5K5_9PROT|nr:GNAT family N-acetyltransferase [Caenispirillum salinarum]EKV32379.1 GCN5-related N-acetyltransferase [Caenispirillum salinarum AK4]